MSGVYYIRTKYFITRVVTDDLDWRWRILEYVGINALLAFSCTLTLFLISPAASGSGIPDVKAFLNGVDVPAFKQFFTIKTFVAKVNEHTRERTHHSLHGGPHGAHAWRWRVACSPFPHVLPAYAQVLASALGVSSGMAMGKEGPMLHAGSIVAVIMGSK